MSDELGRGRTRTPTLIGLFRLGAAGLAFVYALRHPDVDASATSVPGQALALGLAGLLAGLAVLQMVPAPWRSRGFDLALLGIDVAVALAFLWMFPFGVDGALFALTLPIQAEAAMVLGITGGIAVWAATAGANLVSGATADSLFPLTNHPATLALSAAGLLLVLLCALMREIATQRSAASLAESRYRLLVEQVPAIVYLCEFGDEGQWIYISPQIESALGYAPDEWLAHPAPFAAHVHPDDLDRAVAEESASGATGQPLRSEYRMVARDGRIVWIRDEATLVRDSGGAPMYWQGLMSDVTEQKQAESQIAFLAYHDKLTDLPNRTMFEELLELALARARRHGLAVAVLYLDLDNFKLVNDSLGHAAGDELLRQMAGRLRTASRETDLVARQGGDEFLMLLSDIEIEGRQHHDLDGPVAVAEMVARRIHDSLREPFLLAETEFFVSASIGISVYPFHAEDAGTLLRNADGAMYESKRNGPGGALVHSENGTDALSRLSFITRLRHAVERQNWVLHYQPLVELSNGRMIGVEALLRWQDPSRGLIPPGDFIGLAEEMGLIRVIGDWVLDELCRQATEWRARGIALDMSFNLSPQQLWQPGLVRKVLNRLQADHIDPRSLVMEVTESTAMVEPERTQRVLHELHDEGLRLAIDDFGTGYSSLSRLKQLPVDILKIDRSFIRDIPDDRDTVSMVRAIVHLASSLSMTAHAEGIETEAQWRVLQRHGCALGQGYHFSPPVPASEIELRFGREAHPALQRGGVA